MKNLSRNIPWRKIRLPKIGIIDRYIIGKFLGTYFFALALIIVIVVVFDAAEKIDDFITQKAPLTAIAFEYYLNFVPYFVNQFSGLFTFIAVIFFTSKMAYQTEIIAILSSGVSFRRMMWPYFLSASAIVTLSLGLNLYIIPVANINRLEFERKYIRKMNTFKYERHIYRQITPGVFVYVRDYVSADQSASFLSLERYENDRMVAALETSPARFDPETRHWTSEKYITRTFDGDKEVFEKHTNLDTLINLSSEELGRVDDLVKTMDIVRLSKFIAAQKQKGSDMIASFEVERQSRFAFPVATFILTLIGVSLSSRKVRGGTGLHIGIGIVLCFSYILVSKFAEEFAKGGLLPASIAVWLPNIIYLFIAIYLYRKAPK